MITAGEVVRLNDVVTRITSPNPGVMTGPGTNSYLIGRQELALLDPGPVCDRHMAALLAFAAGRIRWILVSHTHPDHSPMAKQLAALLQVPVYGNAMPDDGFQDPDFRADHSFVDQQLFETDEFRLQVITTPGHVGNHLCYWLPQENMVFTGDHIMQGATVVVIPPSGDMAAYLRSMKKLQRLPVKVLAPGHGELIHQPQQEMANLIKHRLWREQQVIEVLGESGPIALEDLAPLVYPTVSTSLMIPAQMSLLAHLYKLEAENVVHQTHERWQLRGQK